MERMRAPPDLSAFDQRFKDMSPEEREESKDLIRRYLELVVKIADEHWALTEEPDDGKLGL